MEAGARTIEGDKAVRIVDAMRTSVGSRGVAGATFDHVAREAGVSRGLLHYYFGSKERLLAEVLRRDCEVRQRMLDERLGEARTAEDVIAGLVLELQALVREAPEFLVLLFEFFTLSQRNDDIAAEFTELVRQTRERVAGLLQAKHDEGVLRLRGDAEAVADVLFGMAEGVGMRMIAEPERDWDATVEAGVVAVGALLG